MIEITSEIEKDPKLVREYGYTMAHCIANEVLLGEILNDGKIIFA